MQKKLIYIAIALLSIVLIYAGVQLADPWKREFATSAVKDKLGVETPVTNESPLKIPEKNEHTLVSAKVQNLSQDRTLLIPEGFEISAHITGLEAPRGLVIDDQNNIYITDKGAGKVYVFTSQNQLNEIDAGLRNIHGIDFFNGDLYVAEETQLVVYRNIQSSGDYDEKETLTTILPEGGGHVTRTVKIGPDEKIYISSGSSCNVCEESNELRATIARFDLNGNLEGIVAEGLRNAVGFTFVQFGNNQPEIWSVNNGRDLLGDNVPSEEVDIIRLDDNFSLRETAPHYGWPHCYGHGEVDPDFGQPDFCANESYFAKFLMQAHSAPLDITYNQTDGLFYISFHGSWNRTSPTGYKVVTLNPAEYIEWLNNSGANATEEEFRTITFEEAPADFITGWLDTSSGRSWGRPVGLAFDSEGSLFIADDQLGVVYKMSRVE